MTNTTHQQWLHEMIAAARAAASARLPVFYDIGARDGLAPGWDLLARLGLVTAIGLEPDQEHCAELARRDPHVRYLPAALADGEGERTLYRTRMPGCSSLREPNYPLLSRYPAATIFDPAGTATIEVTRLDALAARIGLPAPDFVKIDTQGSELDILRGFGALLAGVTGIELEAQFQPMYKGQALLPEVASFLGTRDIVLRELRPNGPYEGELLEVDAFFSRRPAPGADVTLLRLWQLATELSSPLFLSQMTDWLPEWKTGLTEGQVELRRALFGA